MQGIIGAVFGAIIGAIFTFFFNRENEKKKNAYNLEKDYIEKVCVEIVQYLEENNKNDSLSREDIEHIVDFIEQVYKNNYLIIGEEDKTVLNAIKSNINGDFNTLVQNYTLLKDYFNNKVITYQKKIRVTPKEGEDFSNLCIGILILIWGMIIAIIGICGIFGIYGFQIWLYDKYGYGLFYKQLGFAYDSAPYAFLFVGITIEIFTYFIYFRKIKH